MVPVLAIAAALATVSSSALAQNTAVTRPATRATTPAVESALDAGETVLVRWEPARDATNTQFVVAQTRATDQRFYCIVAALNNGAWVLHRSEMQFGGDAPNECFSAALVNNRWVFASWNLGGSGDGRDRVDESSVSFESFIGGRFVTVGGIASHQLSVLRGGATLTLLDDRNRPLSFAWNAAATALTAVPDRARSARRR